VTPGPVTVVIPTRNRGARVAATVHTVLANDHPDFEVVVVDESDGGATHAALDDFDAEPRLRYVRTEARGSAAGRNAGVREARGEIVAITDDDCEVPPDWLRKLVAAFEVDHRTGLVFGNVRAGPHDTEAGFVVSFERERGALATSLAESHRVDGVAACMGVRRSAWEALGGFDTMLGLGAPLRSAAEIDFGLRALRAGYYVYETPDWSATHHGFRPAGESRAVIDRYWYGTGAVMAKSLKLRDWRVWQLPLRLAWRWARRGREGVDLDGRFHPWLRLGAFARGLAAGLLTPLDQSTGCYRRTGG
jgi:GT2 family glycosyltransferase